MGNNKLFNVRGEAYAEYATSLVNGFTVCIYEGNDIDMTINVLYQKIPMLDGKKIEIFTALDPDFWDGCVLDSITDVGVVGSSFKDIYIKIHELAESVYGSELDSRDVLIDPVVMNSLDQTAILHYAEPLKAV